MVKKNNHSKNRVSLQLYSSSTQELLIWRISFLYMPSNDKGYEEDGNLKSLITGP